MNNEQKEALFGSSAKFSEHKAGDEILVQRGIEVVKGTILHVRAPGPTHEGGSPIGLCYMVDMGTGFPQAVLPSQIVEGSLPDARTFPVILASYGALTNGCTLSRKAAENLAVNVQGQVIDTDQGRLRVLSARIEGDEKAGQVLAECEAVIESEQNQEGE